MKERPILFSGPMVRAILDDRKTQTRREIKHPEYFGCLTGDCPHERQSECDAEMPKHCPYGAPGDRLWVRESLTQYPRDKTRKYTADRASLPIAPLRCEFRNTPAIPSIHMPRWACRIVLEIAEVRVQLLNDIGPEDAEAEGFISDEFPIGGRPTRKYGLPGWEHQYFRISPVDAYQYLWDSINGPGSWGTNPWVWAITFKRVK